MLCLFIIRPNKVITDVKVNYLFQTNLVCLCECQCVHTAGLSSKDWTWNRLQIFVALLKMFVIVKVSFLASMSMYSAQMSTKCNVPLK